MKTLEQQREYLRNWRAKKRLEKARLKAEETEPVVLSPPPQEPFEAVDNITPDVDNASESGSEETSADGGESEWEDTVEEAEQQPPPVPKEQPGLLSKLIMALVLSIAMPVIGLVVARLGGPVGMSVSNECAEFKKKDLEQSEQSAQLPTTSLAPSCDNIDGLGLKFT